MAEEVLLKCLVCDHEEIVDRYGSTYGCAFEIGFTFVCDCLGSMEVIPIKSGSHTTECDKVLARYGRPLC